MDVTGAQAKISSTVHILSQTSFQVFTTMHHNYINLLYPHCQYELIYPCKLFPVLCIQFHQINISLYKTPKDLIQFPVVVSMDLIPCSVSYGSLFHSHDIRIPKRKQVITINKSSTNRIWKIFIGTNYKFENYDKYLVSIQNTAFSLHVLILGKRVQCVEINIQNCLPVLCIQVHQMTPCQLLY